MHVTLSKYLEKIGVKDIKDASQEEKQTFDRWNGILSEKEITIEDIKKLCAFERVEIEKKFDNTLNPDKLNERLIIMHSIWRKIEHALEGDVAEREALQKYIEDLLDNTPD